MVPESCGILVTSSVLEGALLAFVGALVSNTSDIDASGMEVSLSDSVGEH